MYIEYPEQLTPDMLQERDLYDELLGIESELDRSITANKIRQAAKNIGKVKVFDDNYKQAQKEFARVQKRELANTSEIFGACLTDFSLRDSEGQFNCGDWIANDEGISLHTDKGFQTACSHQIFINRILRNVESGKYKAEVIFQIPGRTVQTLYVDRKTIASANKILDLADYGVIVTSLNAPLLVKYLSDLQTLNPDLIEERASTSRLGWINAVDNDGNLIKQFLPYESEIVFDNLEMMRLFNSIKPHGDRDKWYSLAKEIRAKRQPEVLMNFAASFASVILEPCGCSPFILSLWGETGIGKTVILKLCTSVWANPKDGYYITDPKATKTALEMRLNVLNNLPMVIDDMAQISMQSDIDFSKQIYEWCAGKGRERSNQNLGLRELTHWCNATITNGERSLVDESMQGGAINRVIDVESSGEQLFDSKSGNKTVRIIENNYGFAGEEFIYHLSQMGYDGINQIYNEYYDILKKAMAKQGVEKEDKQIMPMTVMLAADYLSEKYLFEDGVRIDVYEALKYLKNKGEVSEASNAYSYLMDTIAANMYRFDGSSEPGLEEATNVTKWGFWKDEDTVAIIGSEFEKRMKEGGYQGKSFLAWAKKRNLVECDAKGNPKKVVKFSGRSIRAVIIKTNYNAEEAPVLRDSTEIDREQLPFT